MSSGATISRSLRQRERMPWTSIAQPAILLGSRGIGKAIARNGSEAGPCGDVPASPLTPELAARPPRYRPLAADVTSKGRWTGTGRRGGAALGGLHILVQRVPARARHRHGPIHVIDEDLIEDFNVKYVGALRCSRAVIPFMKTGAGGRIINISGGNARTAGNLAAARACRPGDMTKTLAVHLGRHAITVNCIHPGTTRTERRRACSPPARPNWAYPRKRRSGGLRSGLAAPIRSAAW